MVAADPRVVPVSADPISSGSAIEPPSARPGCMHTAPRRNKISRSLSGCIFYFYADRHWTNMSALQKSTEASALLKCISGGRICTPACARTARSCARCLRDVPSGSPSGFLSPRPELGKKHRAAARFCIFIVLSDIRSCLGPDTQDEVSSQK